MSYLEAADLCHAYKDQVVLNHFSFSAEEGECVSLMGPSGSGKTTVLRILCGLLKPDKGKVILEGNDISMLEPCARKMAMVFQNAALFPHTRIRDNIAYGMHKLGYSKKEIIEKTEAAAALLHIEDQLNKYPGALSGGQRQRAGIARAIVRDPKILLLDEPFSSLDKELKTGLINEISEIRRNRHITMVFVTHDEAEAQLLSDRIINLKQVL